MSTIIGIAIGVLLAWIGCVVLIIGMIAHSTRGELPHPPAVGADVTDAGDDEDPPSHSRWDDGP